MALHIGHVALRVPDLGRTTEHYKVALGLRETSRTGDQVFLSSNEKHHELQLIQADAAAVDHIGLELDSDLELRELRDRVVAHGGPLIEHAPEPGIAKSIRFAGPAGILHEAYVRMDRTSVGIEKQLRAGVRKLGHLTFFVTDPAAVETFWVDVLGFRISDRAGDIVWLRCDPDHHGLAVGAHGERNMLNHSAWEVQDVSAIVRHCDELALHGLELCWGPVRHGPGFNLATYQCDCDGGLIEVYADLLKIYDELGYTPFDWSGEPRALNLWGPGPAPEVTDAGIPVHPAIADTVGTARPSRLGA